MPRPAARGRGRRRRPDPGAGSSTPSRGQLGRGSSGRRTFSSSTTCEVGSTPSRSSSEIRSTCSRIPESSPAIRSTSSSREPQPRQLRHVQYLLPLDHGGDSRRAGPAQQSAASQLECPPMRRAAESFVVLSLRLLALSFAVVGILFIAVPNGVLDTISDLGDELGSFSRAPPDTEQQLWLALAFAYMVVITGICLIAQTDVVRYRPLLLAARGRQDRLLARLARLLPLRRGRLHLPAQLPRRRLPGAARALALVAGRPDRPPAGPG